MTKKSLLSLLLLCVPLSLFAELQLPHFFSDHMVLQRERNAAVWGTAAPGADVTVSFKGKSTTATADKDGKWRVQIETGKADKTGADLSIASQGKTKIVRDVLVGEVWLASGQSNMYFSMNRVPAYAELVSKTNIPTLRMFNAALTPSATPQDDIDGAWHVCDPETTKTYSAVAFFFARKLSQDLDIPIGIISSSWGGKPVETFTSRAALKTLPGTAKLVDALLQQEAAFDAPAAQESFVKRLATWQKKLAELRKNKAPAAAIKKLGRKPTAPKRPLATEGRPGVLFDGMIHPFIGYTMRGAIWYQGEANAKPGAVPYDQTLPLMINDWRSRWEDKFSFYFVQLANFRAPSTEPGTPDPWALCQDRMRKVINTTPKTGMAIINDVGDEKDIHPKNKRDVGERLARWALAKDYGQSVIISGPLYRSHQVKEDAVHVTFSHAGKGLAARNGGPLKRFEVAGADKKWHWGDATITSKDTVAVRASEVPHPVAVRYAWASNPTGANLVNSDDLPTSIFRTDDWEDVEPASWLKDIKAAQEQQKVRAHMRRLMEQRKTLKRGSDEDKKLAAELLELREKANVK